MLEFLPELFDSLKGEAYALIDLEAAIFLPWLIEVVLFIILNYMDFALNIYDTMLEVSTHVL